MSHLVPRPFLPPFQALVLYFIQARLQTSITCVKLQTGWSCCPHCSSIKAESLEVKPRHHWFSFVSFLFTSFQDNCLEQQKGGVPHFPEVKFFLSIKITEKESLKWQELSQQLPSKTSSKYDSAGPACQVFWFYRDGLRSIYLHFLLTAPGDAH